MKTSRILIVDLQVNNLTSLINALKRQTDIEILIIQERIKSQENDFLILPGNGNFESGMNQLQKSKLDSYVIEHVELGRKLFGICLGLQLLFDSSEESVGTKGLGLITGKVRKIQKEWGTRIPHNGWNSTYLSQAANIFSNSLDRKDFYFSHSFIVEPNDPQDIICKTMFDSDIYFASGVFRENIFGVQFHPEKSSNSGAFLFQNLIDWYKSEI